MSDVCLPISLIQNKLKSHQFEDGLNTLWAHKPGVGIRTHTFILPMSTAASHRLNILSKSEIHELYGLPVFSEPDRQHYFDVSPAELVSVQARTPGVGLFQSLELGYFKAKRQFFDFQRMDVAADLRHVAGGVATREHVRVVRVQR